VSAIAERRMFAKTITRSDAFLDMSASAQNLYFHLNAEADDEGFVNNPKSVMRLVKAADDDLRLLIAKKFLIPFESGVVVIKHWRIHNYIRGDRIRQTKYQAEKDLLELDENNAYRLPDKCPSSDRQLPDKCQHRLGKVSIGKYSLKEEVQSTGALHTVFESLWALYPNKKGKGRVSNAQKKKLMHIGLEEMSRAIDRYLDELKQDEWRKPQNGSTFFNSGYVDYLDENYTAAEDATRVLSPKYKIITTEDGREVAVPE